jgi:hypothetical protein
LVSKTLFTALIFGLFSVVMYSQEENLKGRGIDSVQSTLEQDGIVLQDSIIKKENYINPLAPSKAAFYSAVLPGLGQVYNKRYWKAPIVWGALGAGIYAYTFYDNQYNDFRTAFKRQRVGLENERFSAERGFDTDRLERLQNNSQNERDLALLVTIIIYALNIVDANVDAHLKQFNISDDLSWDLNLQPYLENNPVNSNPNYGMALTITF